MTKLEVVTESLVLVLALVMWYVGAVVLFSL